MQISFIGGGKMAEAIINGLVSHQIIEPENIFVCDPDSERCAFLTAEYGVNSGCSNLFTETSDVVILAVKPQNFEEALENVNLTKRHLVISIAAGITLAKIRSIVGSMPRCIRIMPNLALAVNEGMSAFCADALEKDKKFVIKVFETMGAVCETPEDEFDTVTALSGSGPAFFAYVLQQLANGAAKKGLPAEVAEIFALQTMLGTAKYLIERGQPIDEFINDVSSKGGTTEAGMEILKNSDVATVMKNTISAAAKRSKELRG